VKKTKPARTRSTPTATPMSAESCSSLRLRHNRSSDTSDFEDIATGISYLHNNLPQPFVHGDLTSPARPPSPSQNARTFTYKHFTIFTCSSIAHTAHFTSSCVRSQFLRLHANAFFHISFQCSITTIFCSYSAATLTSVSLRLSHSI